MAVNVSSNEARNHLGRLLKLASEEDEDVIIKVHGNPTAVLISYAEYEQIGDLKKMEKRLRALETVRELRRTISDRTAQLSTEEAYRLAGFGEKATEDIVENDRQIAAARL